MSGFRQTHFVTFSAMLLAFGLSTARAGTDEGKKQADAQPVTSETRRQIVEHLLEVVRDAEESDEVRASAARSLGTQTSDLEENKAEFREALLKIVKTEDAAPDLQLAAIEALRESDVELTEEHLKAIGEALWNLVVKHDGTDEQEQRFRLAAVVEFNRYEADRKSVPPPDNVAAVQTLLIISRTEGFIFLQSGRSSKDRIANATLHILTESEAGIRLLIKALDSLEMESPEDISEMSIDQFRHSSQSIPVPDPSDLSKVREEAAKYQYKEGRKKLVTLLENVSPKNEAIAQLLLEAASHENPDVRAAAIAALGNAIPSSDEGARPAEPVSPAAPTTSS